MSTLAVMKQRIADELARSDLTPMIAYAISDAIKHYQSKRFFFNESRDIEFDTVDDQEWYDKFDHAAIPNLMAIDYIRVDDGGTIYTLCREEPEAMENISSTPATGVPTSFTYYNRQIRFYPVPDDVYEVTIAAHLSLDEPASDSTINNAWMTDAERLIRARAKINLARNVNAAGLDPMFSDKAIMLFKDEENDAFTELKARTAKSLGTGKIKPYW
jgi:hypothetical protein